MADAPFTAIIVFGPEAIPTAAQYREAGLDGIIEGGADAGSLELPPFMDARITLAFAHRVPERWALRSRVDAWLLALIEGLGIGRYEMGFPDLRGHGTPDSDAAVLMLNWFGASHETVLKVARAIDRSYLALTTPSSR
jgi:hypothetical protein